MIKLLDLALWVEQIKTTCPAFDGRVFETLENDNAALDFYGTPLALVYVTSDSSDASESSNRVYQKHNSVIAVRIGIQKTTNKNDRLSAADSRLIRSCRIELLNALVGWIPSDCEAPIEHADGALMIKEPYLLWTDKFNAFDYLESAEIY